MVKLVSNSDLVRIIMNDFRKNSEFYGQATTEDGSQVDLEVSDMAPIARDLTERANKVLSKFKDSTDIKTDAPKAWAELLEEAVIVPDLPIRAKQAIMDAAFDGWDEKTMGLRPHLQASTEQTNVRRDMEESGSNSFDEHYAKSVINSREFYADQINKMGIPLYDENNNRVEATAENIADTTDPVAPVMLVGLKLNIADKITENAKNNPDGLARSFTAEGEQVALDLTWKEFDEKVSQAANALVEMGVKPNDNVGFDVRLGLDSELMYYGAIRMGAVPAAWPGNFATNKMEAYLDEFPEKPKLIITHDYSSGRSSKGDKFPLYELVAKVPDAPQIVALTSADENTPEIEAKKKELERDNDVVTNVEKLISDQPTTFESYKKAANETVSRLPSSGTSSVESDDKPVPPKILDLNAGHFIGYGISARTIYDATPDTVVTPILGGIGWMMHPLTSFGTVANESTMAFSGAHPNSPEQWDVMEKSGTNVHVTNPGTSENAMKNNYQRGRDLSSMKKVVSSGGPVTEDVDLFMGTLAPGGNRTVQVMGGTEQNISTADYDERANTLSSFNSPALGRAIYVAQEGDSIVEADNAMPGEYHIVMFTGPNMTPSPDLSQTGQNFDNRDKYYADELRIPVKKGDEIEFVGFKLRIEGAYDRQARATVILPNGTELEEKAEIFLDDGAIRLRDHGDLLSILPDGNILAAGRADNFISVNNGNKTTAEQLDSYVTMARIPGIARVAAVPIETGTRGQEPEILYAIQTDDTAAGKLLERNPEKAMKAIKAAVASNDRGVARVDYVIAREIPGGPGKVKRAQIADEFKASQEAAREIV